MTEHADLVGQSLMLQFQGPEITDAVREAMGRIRPCGVVLFSSNIRDRESAHTLCGDLQAEAAAIGLPPLLIAADQEGGTVSRLPAPFVTVPSPMAQAATGDPEAAYTCARISGRQMREVGITVNFAPALDVNIQPTNPVIRTRSFGDNPELVTRFGLAAIRGYEAERVIATAKHFPGHGDTTVDSHHGLPVVRFDRARLDTVELAPFAAAVAAGIPAVMTAHIIFSALDEWPATLSSRILTGLLREELGFDGLIVTDAMDMGAIVGRYGRGEAAIAAKAAGADVLEMVDTLEHQLVVAAALNAAVAGGILSTSLFERSAERVDQLRQRYGITHDLPPLANLDPELAADALAVARRGITIVRGREVLPLSPQARLAVIDCQRLRSSIAEDPVDRAAAFQAAVLDAFPRATCVAISEEPEDETLREACALAQSAETVLFLTRDANHVDVHAALGRELAAGPAPVIHVAVRAPYDAGAVPGAAAVLLTYGDPPLSLRALVDVLAGRAVAAGISPVTLSDLAVRSD